MTDWQEFRCWYLPTNRTCYRQSRQPRLVTRYACTTFVTALGPSRRAAEKQWKGCRMAWNGWSAPLTSPRNKEKLRLEFTKVKC